MLVVRRIGYRAWSSTMAGVASVTSSIVSVRLAAITTVLDRVQISAASPVALDTRTGDQVYTERDSHAAPTTTTSQIVQQAIAGAARAPTGEVHIRGQHAEYTYYIDGVPIPPSISGSLNELFDPSVADRIDFQTGGWDAEYGNRNIAIVNVQTRVPQGGLRVQGSAYAGSYDSKGQSILASTTAGRFALLLSLSRQGTAMRREPVMRDSSIHVPLNFHNTGDDEFGFAKADYAASARDRLTLEANASATRFAVPFDSTGGVTQDDHEHDANWFVSLSWRRQSSDTAGGGASPHALFAAVYVRRGSLRYLPGAIDQPQFIFYPDTTQRYTVREARSATTTGVSFSYTVPLARTLAFKTGLDASLVTGREDFDARDSLNELGPTVRSGLRGGDAGAYAQAVFTPSSRWELRAGLRLDHHVAPLAGDSHQLSPRVRLAFFPDPATSLWVYYGRLFIPSNVEDFHVLASAAQKDTVGLPTVPERDRYWEAGVVHRFHQGVVAKLAGYYRDNSPAIDDNTLPGTAITTTVNIARVHVAGIESAIELHPGGPFSGYLNAALSHASAHGPITGGFFPTSYPAGWFDQDHDQRLSIVASGTFAARWGYVGLTGIFGSGLTNGHPDAAPNGTGLFDFNRRVKVAPNLIVDASAGTQFTLHGVIVHPEVYVDNVLDRRYILKGAFTSGPSIGRPRSFVVKITIGQ